MLIIDKLTIHLTSSSTLVVHLYCSEFNSNLLNFSGKYRMLGKNFDHWLLILGQRLSWSKYFGTKTHFCPITHDLIIIIITCTEPCSLSPNTTTIAISKSIIRGETMPKEPRLCQGQRHRGRQVVMKMWDIGATLTVLLVKVCVWFDNSTIYLDFTAMFAQSAPIKLLNQGGGPLGATFCCQGAKSWLSLQQCATVYRRLRPLP